MQIQNSTVSSAIQSPMTETENPLKTEAVSPTEGMTASAVVPRRTGSGTIS